MLLAILEAASGEDSPLRNILLDPKLLGAVRSSHIGKLYPDTNCPGALNVSKMANAFCMSEWGCGIRDAILDDGKPVGRAFKEDWPVQDDPPPHIYDRPPIDPAKVPPLVTLGRHPYDWRRTAKSMGDRGWRRYFRQEELDLLL